MNERLRKSFSNSTNLSKTRISLRKDANIGSFHHMKNKLPTIVINSKNSELLGFSKDDKNFSKSLLKQKSLNLSKTQHYHLKKKITHSNFNLRKNSTNTLNINTKINSNNNSNNIAPLNYNQMRKSDKLVSKHFLASENTYDQTISYNNRLNININPLIIKKIKNPNDFAVSDEDRIFNQFKKKKDDKSKLKNKKMKMKAKIKKQKLNKFSSYDAALSKVYKQIPRIINKIENTKKLKGNMSLYKYQNLLMDVGTKNLNRETREKLNNKFMTLRNLSDKRYNLFKDTLENIETEEKKIIESINTQQNYYKKKMNEPRFNATLSRNLGFLRLPNLEFRQLIKPKIKYKYKKHNKLK